MQQMNANSERAGQPGGASAVIHVPHAATLIPGDVREQFVLTDEEIADELRLMTDHLTDQLFAMPEAIAIAVRSPVSRLVVDPERFEKDARVCAVMIEVNRRLYLDELTGLSTSSCPPSRSRAASPWTN